ncbi:MAG TPA: hypothetical protein VMD99_06535 [Terriglobales bacterium]|nr:hypothetical protein [Terriglobales bacterium]HUO24320.1 hypothetical protein [Candidatus Aquilonibacter sp.]
MTPSTPVQDLATQWSTARRLYPIYFELAREFAIEVKPCADLEAGVETPGKEAVEQANHWLEQMDSSVQVHQLRQFLQTSSLVTPESLVALLQHFLAKTPKDDAVRDKTDFLLVQYFSQIAPTGVDDGEVDLAYVAQALEPILGQVELKTPVWLNSLDRVLESARRCKSLDELLHGGVLEQGRKAKGLAGELFYIPVALVAFTRFGYLMRRAFFRLMLGDLNIILDGLTELEDKGVQTIDCRRAQFSAQEPIIRLRMICQSWKVMFQAEYSSGSPLRMLVDLRASVETALGRGKAEPAAKAAPASAKPAAAPAAKPAVAGKTVAAAGKAPSSASAKPLAKAAAAPAGNQHAGKPVPAKADPPEFDVSGGSGWDPDAAAKPKK